MRSNERKATRKPIYFYPGKDVNHNLIAVPAANTLITGDQGVGKTSLINQLVLRLIQDYSYVDMNIHLFSGEYSNCYDWAVRRKGEITQDRVLPSIVKRQKTDSIRVVFEYIEKLTSCDSGVSDIIFIDDIPFDWNDLDYVKNVLEECVNKGICVVWVVPSVIQLLEEILPYFTHKCVFKVEDSVNQVILGSNASVCSERGRFMLNSTDSLISCQEITVPFTPISVLNKIVGAFSIRCNTVESIVDFAHKDSKHAASFFKRVIADMLE